MAAVDWGQAGSIALTGVLSVFLALGFLSLVVGVSGRLLGQSKKGEWGQSGETGQSRR
ncbi:MAG: OadG family protein [Desulfotomaculaceae bacterium]|nr:OadG family protein [Desulfotomaculaceae bacterium]